MNTDFLIEHVELLCSSYRHWTGTDLIAPASSPIQTVSVLREAPYAVLSHGNEPDPIINYGNRLALQLFERDWGEFVRTPSRYTTEPARREDRLRLLEQVTAEGYAENYTGIRISKSGRRFMIREATVWNVVDRQGGFHGQAAVIRAWEYV